MENENIENEEKFIQCNIPEKDEKYYIITSYKYDFQKLNGKTFQEITKMNIPICKISSESQNNEIIENDFSFFQPKKDFYEINKEDDEYYTSVKYENVLYLNLGLYNKIFDITKFEIINSSDGFFIKFYGNFEENYYFNFVYFTPIEYYQIYNIICENTIYLQKEDQELTTNKLITNLYEFITLQNLDILNKNIKEFEYENNDFYEKIHNNPISYTEFLIQNFKSSNKEDILPGIYIINSIENKLNSNNLFTSYYKENGYNFWINVIYIYVFS